MLLLLVLLFSIPLNLFDVSVGAEERFCDSELNDKLNEKMSHLWILDVN